MNKKFSKFKNEVIKVWALTFYFIIFFSAIAYFRFALLQHAGVPYTTFVLGIVNAAICAKFLVISQLIYPLKSIENRPLCWAILGRSGVYVIVVTIFIAIEESVVGLIHGRSVVHSITGLVPGTLNIFFSLEILYWLMVIPYVTYSAIAFRIGENNLSIMLFGYKNNLA